MLVMIPITIQGGELFERGSMGVLLEVVSLF